MSSSSTLSRIDELSAELEGVTAEGRTDALSQAELQRLMRAVVRLYAAKFDADAGFPAVPYAGINATEAMVSASALLKAANLNVFELGLWQQWS
jgi:hypothetical protein